MPVGVTSKDVISDDITIDGVFPDCILSDDGAPDGAVVSFDLRKYMTLPYPVHGLQMTSDPPLDLHHLHRHPLPHHWMNLCSTEIALVLSVGCVVQ